MCFIFNGLGFVMVAVGVIVGLALEWAGLVEPTSTWIGCLLMISLDVAYRFKNYREHQWKRFFYPSTGGQWFFLPLWFWVGLFLWSSEVMPMLRSDVKNARTDISRIRGVVEARKDRNGRYPRTDTEPKDIDFKSNDPWGNPYNYEFPSQARAGSYAIWSNGPNGENEEGEGDDINSWSDD
jgi:hypothetical protein